MQKELRVAICELNDVATEGITPMLQEEIAGTYPMYGFFRADTQTVLPALLNRLHLLFLIRGTVVFEQGNANAYTLSERGVYIPDPHQFLKISAKTDCAIFMLSWELSKEDKRILTQKPIKYPYIQIYKDCPQYTESFKSDRTVSRTIVPHNLLPRFSMGSNEAEENDRVEMNNHPHIDQYFFSFPENNVDLLIEDKCIHFKGNTLLHVPLGCNHGVKIGAGQKMHYIWIDYIIDDEGLTYLDTVHKPIVSER